MCQIQRFFGSTDSHVVGRTAAEKTDLGSGGCIIVAQGDQTNAGIAVVSTGIGNIQVRTVRCTEAQIGSVIVPDRGGIGICHFLQSKACMGGTVHGLLQGGSGQYPMGGIGKAGIGDDIGDSLLDPFALGGGTQVVGNRALRRYRL